LGHAQPWLMPEVYGRNQRDGLACSICHDIQRRYLVPHKHRGRAEALHNLAPQRLELRLETRVLGRVRAFGAGQQDLAAVPPLTHSGTGSAAPAGS
jgi:hypothetical protein